MLSCVVPVSEPRDGGVQSYRVIELRESLGYAVVVLLSSGIYGVQGVDDRKRLVTVGSVPQ